MIVLFLSNDEDEWSCFHERTTEGRGPIFSPPIGFGQEGEERVDRTDERKREEGEKEHSLSPRGWTVEGGQGWKKKMKKSQSESDERVMSFHCLKRLGFSLLEGEVITAPPSSLIRTLYLPSSPFLPEGKIH